MQHRYTKKIALLAAACGLATATHAQDALGLGTGNFAGIAGLTLNPAHIVDSRYKFDINLFGISNYYTNNYVLLKRNAFLNGAFKSDRYDSYDKFRAANLELNTDLKPQDRVYARLRNRIQAPLSFMLTTSPRSAIALNIVNRTDVAAENLPQGFARLAYDRFRNPQLVGVDFNFNNSRASLLNWLDVGLTYGRILADGDKHFLKGAITVKYVGAAASGYFQADQLNLRFNDTSVISASTGNQYASYGHSSQIDENLLRSFRIADLKDISSTVGFDAGLVYEFRGRIDRFRFMSSEYTEKTRRDVNKYVFRIGASLMDVGRLRFNRGGYNNDFAANFNNWNVADLSIKSAQDLDTALAGRVNYRTTTGSKYTVALPTAYSVQADLHLWRGFYINAATYQPLKVVEADQRVPVTTTYAVTPRFESRVFGVYVPVSHNKTDGWNLGATLRIGPLYLGSANLATLLVREKTRTADIHAGLHVPIAFGKKSKAGSWLEKTFTGSNTRYGDVDVVNNTTTAAPSVPAPTVVVQQPTTPAPTIIQQPSNNADVATLQARIAQLEQARQQPVQVTINNYGATEEHGAYTSIYNSQDSSTRYYGNKPRTTTQDPVMAAQLRDAQAELARIREEMARLKAAGAITPQQPSAQPIIIRDTVVRYIRDTMRVTERDTIRQTDVRTVTTDYTVDNLLSLAPEKVLFDVGKSVVKPAHYRGLDFVAAQLKKYPELRVRLSGFTDQTGNAAKNLALSEARSKAVQAYLVRKGVSADRMETNYHGAADPVGDNTQSGKLLNRRVEVEFIR